MTGVVRAGEAVPPSVLPAATSQEVCVGGGGISLEPCLHGTSVLE